MNDEQKIWSRQYASSIGTKEFIRVGCAIIIWIFLGIGLTLAFHLTGYSADSAIFNIFFIAMFAFQFVATRWKPAYSLLRKILGNENLPIEPYPRTISKTLNEPRPWWSYLPGIWFLILELVILYIIFWKR
jgi:hypothetical protein